MGYLSLKSVNSFRYQKRRNMSLIRGISVLTGGAFEQVFCPEEREFEQANLQKFKCPGLARGGGGGLKFRFD